MYYTISRILRLDACHVQVLPYGRFILEDEQGEKRESEGWLPCHHGNIQYELEFKKNGDIASIQWMRTGRKKNRTPVHRWDIPKNSILCKQNTRIKTKRHGLFLYYTRIKKL